MEGAPVHKLLVTRVGALALMGFSPSSAHRAPGQENVVTVNAASRR